MSHRLLEQKWGFFVYLQRVYPIITPFLKGFHPTLDSWHPGHASDMWKLPKTPHITSSEDGMWDDTTDTWVPLNLASKSPPEFIKSAPKVGARPEQSSTTFFLFL